MHSKIRPIITVLGGGTGTFVILSALKKLDFDLGVIVTMTDSGGSTGKLRDELGVLPPGDLRQCLVALSHAPLLWRKLFLYRFARSSLKGHNFGNIFLSVLEKLTSNYNEVIDMASELLNVKGEVIPVTFDKTHLVATYSDGKVIKGEGKIDEKIERSAIASLTFSSETKLNPRAKERVQKSDILVFGIGDVYTSILPVILVPGMIEAIQANPTLKIVLITNLANKLGQTQNFSLSNYQAIYEKTLGRKIDVILVNNEPIDEKVLSRYLAAGELPPIDDLIQNAPNIIRMPLLQKFKSTKVAGDKLARSLLRHDKVKLRKVLKNIIKGLSNKIQSKSSVGIIF